MQSFNVVFAAVVIAAACLCHVAADDKSPQQHMMVGSSYGGGAPAPSYGGGAPAPSYGGGASIPAPPCAKNYLFSCQPNLAPVPCSPPAAPSYGSSGAYSENYPVYAAMPQYQGY